MDENYRYGSENMKRKKRRRGSGVSLLAALFVLFVLIIAAVLLINKYLPNFSEESPYTYYEDMSPESLYIVWHDERLVLDRNPVIENGEVYVPADFVRTYLDEYIFWEDGANTLTITTNNEVMRFETDNLNYYINHEPLKLNLPVLKIEGAAYLPVSMVQTLYPAVINYSADFKMVITDKTDTQKQMGRISAKNTNMRYEPDIKSPIQKKLTAGTVITVYNEADEKFTKIRTEDGLIGYIYTKDFVNTQVIAPKVPERESYTPPFTEKIILAWDQIYNYDTNFAESRRAENKGVNVLSPTWLTFDAEKMDGSIINIADLSYVERAHERGVQVWALISDSFNAEIADMVLRNPDTREFVIKQLLTLIKIYDLDGINVDFEQITEDTAPYYLQFMRELAPFMRDAGAVLSVDMYVPTYTKHYNRTEVAKVADYICVMTYDEHYGEASGSGPVASLPFVEDGITETLLEVPKEKLILGLPFYTRVWRETDDGGVSVDANMPMGYAEARFKENGADEFEWIEEAGSYYGQYRADEDGVGVTYKTWFEDAVSIEEKLKLYEKYSLAGVCCWSRGLETDNVWDLIDGYVNN